MSTDKKEKSIIFKMLDMSTWHLKQSTFDTMRNGFDIPGVVYYEKRDEYGLYGFFIHINEDIVNGLEDTDEIPKDLLDCIMYAAGKGCDWINLDADGTVESGVPRYDGDEVVNDVSANE